MESECHPNLFQRSWMNRAEWRLHVGMAPVKFAQCEFQLAPGEKPASAETALFELRFGGFLYGSAVLGRNTA